MTEFSFSQHVNLTVLIMISRDLQPVHQGGSRISYIGLLNQLILMSTDVSDWSSMPIEPTWRS